MSSSSHEHGGMMTLLIRFSNSRRKVLERQKIKGYTTKTISLWELFIFSFFPCVTTSTILAPLNRIKLIMQVKDFQYKDVNAKNTNFSFSGIFNSINIFIKD